jgi:translation initiation factor 2B subunit (eIF-2B alpha/beta/delta family)/8-oxo-dGTP pyrophosphatase MutT (NUDIX family)
MRLRHVVTSFLLHPSDGTVLLGRRSNRVSTYPGHWAAISGSVEDAPPLEQARREIEEETGLRRHAVELLAEGWPIRFTDWRLGASWVVHPYLFRCLAPETVRPDWEHLQFRWAEPERMAELPTVPRLRQAFEAVYPPRPEPGSDWVFRQVRQDRDHGAEELGLWTLTGLRRAVEEAPDGDIASVAGACRRALHLRPGMATVRSAALDVFALTRGLPTGEANVQRLVSAIDELIARREEESLAAAAAGAAAICAMEHKPRIVTLSYSATVLGVLHDAANHVAGLTVAESRPACEGRRTAELAASFGIDTELVTDAVACKRVGDAERVIFGADAVCADGSIANKTGTYALCCAARNCGASALCVTTRSKILPADADARMEEMSPEELGEPIPGVRVRNPCFELVPAHLIDTLLVGGGPIETPALGRRAAELNALQAELA